MSNIIFHPTASRRVMRHHPTGELSITEYGDHTVVLGAVCSIDSDVKPLNFRLDNYSAFATAASSGGLK